MTRRETLAEQPLRQLRAPRRPRAVALAPRARPDRRERGKRRRTIFIFIPRSRNPPPLLVGPPRRPGRRGFGPRGRLDRERRPNRIRVDSSQRDRRAPRRRARLRIRRGGRRPSVRGGGPPRETRSLASSPEKKPPPPPPPSAHFRAVSAALAATSRSAPFAPSSAATAAKNSNAATRTRAEAFSARSSPSSFTTPSPLPTDTTAASCILSSSVFAPVAPPRACGTPARTTRSIAGHASLANRAATKSPPEAFAHDNAARRLAAYASGRTAETGNAGGIVPPPPPFTTPPRLTTTCGHAAWTLGSVRAGFFPGWSSDFIASGTASGNVDASVSRTGSSAAAHRSIAALASSAAATASAANARRLASEASIAGAAASRTSPAIAASAARAREAARARTRR